jgi:hypothetical protein
MNRAMIESILRHLLGGVGAVLTLAMLVWGAVEKRRLTPR